MLKEKYTTACELVREAGQLAHHYFSQRDKLAIEQKANPQDVATEADLQVELLITERISALYPEDGFFGEESGYRSGTSKGIWLADPIDGTANFIRGMAYYCVSLTYVEDGKIVIGAIYDPEQDELFAAMKDHGATLNGKPIAVSTSGWNQAVVGLGRSERHPKACYPLAVERLLASGAEYRRQGAGALSLAHVAAGRIDAYVEPHMNPWDATAGLLIASEAGAVTLPYMDGDWHQGGIAYASTPTIHQQLLTSSKEMVSGEFIL